MELEQSLIQFCQIDLNTLSAQDQYLIENILFLKLYEEVIESFRAEQKPFLRVIKTERKIEQIDVKIIQNIIQDILRSGYYTLSGLAYYTNTPEEILFDLVSGNHSSPSLALSRMLFELHRSIKPEMYRVLLKQILGKADQAA